MDKKQQTINAYNEFSDAHAAKFDAIGPRKSDIDRVFTLIQKTNPKVVEVGCANGRDAEEIVKQTDDYLGIDIAEKLIEKARHRLPTAKFVVADLESYQLPAGTDIVFCFASLLHSPQEQVASFLGRAHSQLNAGGLLFISVKYAAEYTEKTVQTPFGVKTYYYYNVDLIKALAGPGYQAVWSDKPEFAGQPWCEVILQRS